MRISILNRPLFDSLFGVIDLKQGVMLVIFFGLFNKVAGVYGLFGACFAGGTVGQLSFYLYSTASLAGFVWGLNAVVEEHSSRVLLLSHLYLLDHLISTLYTLLFAVVWWTYIPHDGHRVLNSAAQEAMVALAKSRGDIAADELAMDDEGRAAAAALVWGNEKPTAVLVLLACWLMKVYFALILYSFAAHLRHNTYRALPLTTTPVPPSSGAVGSSSDTPGHSRAPSRQAVRSVSSKMSGEEVFSWEEGDKVKDIGGEAANGYKRSTEGSR